MLCVPTQNAVTHLNRSFEQINGPNFKHYLTDKSVNKGQLNRRKCFLTVKMHRPCNICTWVYVLITFLFRIMPLKKKLVVKITQILKDNFLVHLQFIECNFFKNLNYRAWSEIELLTIRKRKYHYLSCGI